ncbi:MAG: hypothetical protein Q7K41_03695 [Dehalococcoidales bacterium]|nr:hypothetical protein [Dehalococcoidales bacterium]
MKMVLGALKSLAPAGTNQANTVVCKKALKRLTGIPTRVCTGLCKMAPVATPTSVVTLALVKNNSRQTRNPEVATT